MLPRRRMKVEFSTTRSIRETRTAGSFARSAILYSAINQCRRITSTLFRSRLLPIIEEFLPMLLRNLRRWWITHNSNTTIAIMRGFRVCCAIVVKTTRRNRPCLVKLHMHLALVVTRSSSQIQQVISARSVTQTRRAERLKPFHRCAVLTPGSTTRNMRAPHVRRVIDRAAVALGCQFPRD